MYYYLQFLTKYKLVPVFNDEEFSHWFLPRQNIIESFVVEKEGNITDMISFYALPSTVMNNATHNR
jgi:glycylpeptide N-tetradecanoyltransferase